LGEAMGLCERIDRFLGIGDPRWRDLDFWSRRFESLLL
jgi:hypothetical protein